MISVCDINDYMTIHTFPQIEPQEKSVMKKKFAAFLREENSLRELAITDSGKPVVDQAFIERWQGVFNLVAAEANAPVALILRVKQDSLSILIKSNNTDQNDIEYYLQNGLYCESDLGKRGLLIANKASNGPQTGEPIDIPSVTACFGLPIQWPDESLFGVVCVLNNPGKVLKPTYRNILSGLKETLEQELVLLQNQQHLPQTSDTDAVTSIYDRSKIEDILKHEFERAKRYFKTFSVTIMDLSGFEKDNDSSGHTVGNDLLRAFAQSIGSKVRETDSWGRWQGDEFILVCPYADTVETQQMIARIKPSVNQEMNAVAEFSDFYFGVSQYEPDDLTYQAIVKRADENMHQYKEMIKRRSNDMHDTREANYR